MKFLGIIISLCIGWSHCAYAKRTGSALQPVPGIEIRIISRDDKGIVRREYFQCTPQTCCFSENFYCFMEKGNCICDLHICGQRAYDNRNRTYWMKIVGTEAERYCGRPRMLHELTNLCICDPYKPIPCDECNPPVAGYGITPVGTTLPQDCSSY